MCPVNDFKLLFTQKHSFLNVWRGSEYVCAQIAPVNVLCHHSKHLMGYFEFQNSSRIICLPLNISEKLHWQRLRKARTGSLPLSLLIRYNTHAPWITTSTVQTNRNHYNFFIRIPILCHVPARSVDKTHVLVLTVELIWLLFLNIFC